MKRRIEILAGCFITVLLTFGMVYKLGALLRPTDTDIAFDAINTFHSMPKNSLEVIGYGSSHIWRGMNPMEMYKKYGIGAYNYGCNWQVINTTELFFKDSLRTQSPKVVLIETYLVNSLRQNVNMNDAPEIYYTKAIPEFDGKRQYLKQCFGNDWERYLSYYMPLCAFHENWVNLSRGSFLKSINSIDFSNTMGYVYTDTISPVAIADPSTFDQQPLSDDAIACLDEIVSICKENGIDIIFYTVPWEGAYAYGDAMKEYAEENDCVYFNLFEYIDETGINCETDFCDVGHLNNSGAIKVADFLGKYIVNHYDVTDMRMIEGNIWEQNL